MTGFFANENKTLTKEEMEEMQSELEGLFAKMLATMKIAPDHNTRETPARMAKMYLEICRGRYEPEPKATVFPNTNELNEIMVIGPIEVNSLCSHHFVPIQGEVFVGVIPGDFLLGASKFHRLAKWVFARPQIQEEATVQLANILEQKLGNAEGLALVVRAKHFCMNWRGVQDKDTEMVTSIMRGVFHDKQTARMEFLELLKGH